MLLTTTKPRNRPQNRPRNVLKNRLRNISAPKAPTAKALLAFSLSCLLGLSSKTLAIEAGSREPIDFSSISFETDSIRGITNYTGDVIITQGQSRLSADKVEVRTEGRALLKIEAMGSPARFQDASDTLPKANSTLLEQHTQGQANKIRYDAKAQTLSFIGQAKLRQGSNTFEGEQIIYDLVARAIKAKGGQGPNERVKIQYYPVGADSENQQGQAEREEQDRPENKAAGAEANSANTAVSNTPEPVVHPTTTQPPAPQPKAAQN